MASLSFMRHASPFAEPDKPPPPVVLLLLHTDLDVHTSTGLVIHEDLEQSATKTVMFAPDVAHTYPPPPIFKEKIPVPTMLTSKIIENHQGWEPKERETGIIKTTVHALVDQLLDTTKALADQDPALVEEVFRQAAQMHPDLRKYEDDWATRCIVQARLKATAAQAANKAVKAVVADAVEIGQRRRKRNQQNANFGVRADGLGARRGSRRDYLDDLIASDDHCIVTSSPITPRFLTTTNPTANVHERSVRSTAFTRLAKLQDIVCWSRRFGRDSGGLNNLGFDTEVATSGGQVVAGAGAGAGLMRTTYRLTSEKLPIPLTLLVRSLASLELLGMPGLDVGGRKRRRTLRLWRRRKYTSPGASCGYGFALMNTGSTRQGKKTRRKGKHSQVRKRPKGGMRAECTAGGEKWGEAGTPGAGHAVETTMQATTP
ncbi:hypothetical protein C8R43DRAFT_958944 [Mycena crocata]|nr:hypothetical protein C8R43DRAFT_958944 [Mycena crocata]